MQTSWYRLRAATFIIMVSSPLAAAAPAGELQSPPPLRQIPGLTAPDVFPRGCVDCHVILPERNMDVRISTLMQQWQVKVEPTLLDRVRAFTPAGMRLKGQHPKLEAATADIPGTCLDCHSQASKSAPPFARLLHGLHLVGGESNHFMTQFQGDCTYCHKLDVETAEWSLGSGSEK